MDQSKNKSLLALVVFFLLFFVINYFTPLHSDDYSYAQFGLSLQRHITHYMTWSGRLIADFVSSLLLTIPGLLKVALNAMAPVLFIFLIVKAFFQDKESSWKVYTLFFLLYWVGNPALGQTTFWIVGAANYLWTSLFALLFIVLTIRQSELYSKNVPFFIYGISAFLAGLTNENVSVTLSAFLFFIICWEKIRYQKLNKKFLYVWIFLILGSAVLILSPGNFIRLGNNSYNIWKSYGLFEKIFRHIFQRMLVHQQKYVYFYIFFGWTYYLAKKNKFTLNQRKIDVCALMFILSLVVNLVMVASPQYPSRALMGGFIFLCLSYSAFLSGILDNQQPSKKFWTCLIVPLSVYFVVAYGLIFNAYYGAKSQEAVRNSVIQTAKANGESEVLIDDFSFSKLLSSRHKFDTFYEEKAMSEYYGINIKVKKDPKLR